MNKNTKIWLPLFAASMAAAVVTNLVIQLTRKKLEG